MAFTIGLHENLTPLTVSDTSTTVRCAAAYSAYGRASAVPVVHTEAEALCRRLPLAWIDGSDDLVCLVSLVPGRSALDADDPLDLSEDLPLLARAFPLAAGANEKGEFASVLLEEPDAPERDNSPPIPLFESEGVLSDAGSSRLDALWLYVTELELTRAMTRRLREASALKPWVLKLRFADGELELGGLLRLNETFPGSAAHAGFLEEFGLPGGFLLEHQRLSTANLASLEALARAAGEAA